MQFPRPTCRRSALGTVMENDRADNGYWSLVPGAKPESLTVIEIGRNFFNSLEADHRCYGFDIILTPISALSFILSGT